MKTKKLNKKLTLNKSTVADLGNAVMVNVVGGATDGMGGCATIIGIICGDSADCQHNPTEADCWTTGGNGGQDCTVNMTCYHLGCN